MQPPPYGPPGQPPMPPQGGYPPGGGYPPAGGFQPPMGGAPQGDPRNMVNGPAIGLMVLGGLSILIELLMLLLRILGTGFSVLSASGGGDAAVGLFSGAIGIVFSIVAIALASFIIFSAMKMKNLQSYNLAMGGAIAAMLPCVGPCCLLGLPLGAWALYVLLQPGVKNAFNG